MNIDFLKKLNTSPFGKQSISVIEIELLELTYNEGQQFPTALRELLFLAGKYCEILEYGLHKSQSEMQDFVRNLLAEENRLILEYFFVIDVYTFPDEFLFVYLDNSHQDPVVFAGNLHHASIGLPFLRSLHRTLSQFLDVRIYRLEIGENPF